MAQVWKVRLPNGQVLIPGDWTSTEPLYSMVDIGTAAFTQLSAFAYGRGQDVPGSVGPRSATLIDTNLEGEGGRLPENEELVVYNVAVECFKDATGNSTDSIPQTDAPHVALLDMLRLQRDLILTFRIAAVKEYTHAPLSYFPASTGVAMVNSGARTVASAGASGFVAGNNGGVSPEDVRTMASPLYVAGGEAFRVDFEPGPGSITNLNLNTNDRIRCRVFLDGYRRRPVA